MKTLITQCLLKLTKCVLSLLIPLLLIFSFASAEIKYKKIDSTISAPLLNQNQVYHLDMNDDGINEYFFNHGNQMGNLVCEIYSEPTSFTNEILVDNAIPTMLNEGDYISSNSSEWLNTYNGVGTNALYFLGNWPGAVEKFVAVRFKINGSYHYGWIGIEMPEDSTYIKIKDCAYDGVAGQSIRAGDKDVEDVYENYSYTAYIHIKENQIFINKMDFNSNDFCINIYDLNGNLLKSSILINSPTVINFENLNSGLYFIILRNNYKVLLKYLVIK